MVLLNDSMNTCTKEAIMATEKINCSEVISPLIHFQRSKKGRRTTPNGSNLRFPVGYLCESVFIPIAKLVPRMMNVLKRSKAESTREAAREIDDEWRTAAVFPPTRRTLTIVFTRRSVIIARGL